MAVGLRKWAREKGNESGEIVGSVAWDRPSTQVVPPANIAPARSETQGGLAVRRDDQRRRGMLRKKSRGFRVDIGPT